MNKKHNVFCLFFFLSFALTLKDCTGQDIKLRKSGLACFNQIMAAKTEFVIVFKSFLIKKIKITASVMQTKL